ncbi:hypothetical protein MUN88_07055 [Gracilibacillus caseinilyticus]|uniref:Uncharacterized protein n=1 Tax=Gracilibacillus caseinilyticus TaxID=2932256 RepID=A0ABY4EZJ6_9BACI|nr:hypothetical protein [Gracilibacillus caseinilyticus]UOQ49825.1 hypothetical protein MUN88_07055 [Gracilibacillus caseinilyticus]
MDSLIGFFEFLFIRMSLVTISKGKLRNLSIRSNLTTISKGKSEILSIRINLVTILKEKPKILSIRFTNRTTINRVRLLLSLKGAFLLSGVIVLWKFYSDFARIQTNKLPYRGPFKPLKRKMQRYGKKRRKSAG